MRNVSRIARRGTQIFPEYKKTVSLSCQKWLREELFQEFSRAGNRILGALSQVAEFLRSPQVRVHSGSDPETSGNPSRENQEPTESHSRNDLHPEARVSLSQSSQDCYPDDAYDTYFIGYGFLHFFSFKTKDSQFCHIGGWFCSHFRIELGFFWTM